MTNPDEALRRLQQIQTDFAAFCQEHGRASESDTRAKVIDAILRDVCGWPESSIQREPKTETGFIDYVLSLPSRRSALVVEAKREGDAFELPTGPSRSLKISGPILTEKSVKKAITQVRSYCDDEGIRYAIATNGYAWIVFRAIRDDMPWREGTAKIFSGLDAVAERFTEFWNLLSFAAVTNGSLEEEFGVRLRPSRQLERVVDGVFNADIPLQRNRLHAQLTPLIKAFFAEIADQDQVEILSHCYVHTESLRIVADDLECVITDSIPRFLEDEGTVPLRADTPQFSVVVSQAMDEPSGELFLILGGIGAGKTTFLKRYRRTVGKALLDEKTIWFNVDFLKAPLDPLELEDFALNEVLDQLRRRYQDPPLETRRNIKRVFSSEIDVLRETALKHVAQGSDEYERILDPHLEKWRGNLGRYVPGLLRVGKPRRDISVLLFVDNVDQLSPAYQAEIFLLAERLTRMIGCVTIISLREESYYTGSVQRTFSAYANRKFHIASPWFRRVIDNRIRYALQVLDSADDMKVIMSGGIQFDKDAIADFLRIVEKSIFQQNRSISEFIEAICFGNMRSALQMFATFLTSGATDVDKMLLIYRRDGAYYVAFHEFVKSIMLGDRKYYREDQSPVMNVFDCGSERNSSHFTALRLMNALATVRGQSSPQGQGYISIQELVAQSEQIFDNLEDCVRTLNRLVVRQLVEVNTRSTESIEGAEHIRLTSAGWYYRRSLTGSFSYLDLVLQDTPIDDPRVAADLIQSVKAVDNLSDRADQKADRMEERFKRVEAFLTYLEKQENAERQLVGMTPTGPISDELVPDLLKDFKKQRKLIRRRIRENRERYEDDTHRAEPVDPDVEDQA